MTNTTNTNTVRVTKAQKYNAIIALLQGEPAIVIPGKEGKTGVTMDAEYLCAFCEAELALLTKKNSPSGEKKLTKAQEKNEEYKKVILSYLSANPSLVVTATDIMENLLRPTYPDGRWTNQKVASLLNALSDKYEKDTGDLVSNGKLIRVPGSGKNKTTFQIKPEYVFNEYATDDAE